MTEQLIISQINQLSDFQKQQVLNYIEFLIMKHQIDNVERKESSKRPSYFGNAKGEVIMSDDFDEPLGDFSK